MTSAGMTRRTSTKGHLMRKRFAALLLVAVVWLLPACSNTVEGLEEDANQNIDEAQEELNDGEDE